MTAAVPLVRFVRELRDEGVPVGPAVAVDLLAAIERVGASPAADVYWALRSLTVTSPSQVAAFDRVFVRFFGTPPGEDGREQVVRRTWTVRAEGDGGDDGDDADEDGTTGAGLAERIATKDFADLTARETVEMRALIAAMVWSPGLVRSRRRRPAVAGDRPDLRRTLRGAVRADGDLLRIATTRRRERPRPLVFVADVSGSMERYAEMLLYFAHALRGRFGHVESFVFSTRLTRITREMERRDPSAALADVAGAVHDWSGGTKIGDAIRTFNREWSRRLSRGGPVVLVVSDGWDRGSPSLLSDEMARLARSVHRIVWLNPLAGRPGYAPETRGMRAALPFVDDFLPAATLEDLASLVSLLASVSPR